MQFCFIYINIVIYYYIFIYNLIVLICLNLKEQLFDRIINSIYNTKQNLDNSKRYTIFQRFENNNNAKT